MTFDRFVEVISGVANIPLVKIHKDSSFKNDLGIDSLQMINLILEISSKLGVELNRIQNNDDLETVGNLFVSLTRE